MSKLYYKAILLAMIFLSFSFYSLNAQDTLHLPLNVIISHDDEGSPIDYTDEKFYTILQDINHTYASTHIQFYVCGDIKHVHNTTLYSSSYKSSPAKDKILLENIQSNKINLFLNISSPGSGYVSKVGGFRYINIDFKHSIDLYTHEIGHYIGLGHPFNSGTFEKADNSECLIKGDKLCDTPPDNNDISSQVNDECVYTNTSTDEDGLIYQPDVHNIMAYGNPKCKGLFSPQQVQEMRAYIISNLSHLQCGGYAPIALASSKFTSACIDQSTSLLDISSGDVSSRQWSADEGIISNAFIKNSFITFSSIGQKNVLLTTENQFGIDTNSTQVNVKSLNTLPISEDFEASTLPDLYDVNTPLYGGVYLSSSAGKDNSQGLILTSNESTSHFKSLPAEETFSHNMYYTCEFEFPCIDARNINGLQMSFDYKLMHHTVNMNTNLCVFVNDVPVSQVIRSTESNSLWQTLQLNLSDYVGQVLHITIKTSSKEPYSPSTGGNAVFIDNINISETDAQPLSVDFNASSSTVCENEIVTFETSIVAGSPSAYEWNFGKNAIPQMTTGKGPHQVKYTLMGKKDVTLLVSDAVGQKQYLKKELIKVLHQPVVKWELSKNEACIQDKSIFKIYEKAGYTQQIWTNTQNEVISNHESSIHIKWTTNEGVVYGRETSPEGCSSDIDTLEVPIKSNAFALKGPAEICANSSEVEYSLNLDYSIKMNEISLNNIGMDDLDLTNFDVPDFDWIEFKNFSNETIDISTWYIKYIPDVSFNGGSWFALDLVSLGNLEGDKVISPGEIVTLQGSSFGNSEFGWDPILSIAQDGYIALYNSTGVLVDFINMKAAPQSVLNEAINKGLWVEGDDFDLIPQTNFQFDGIQTGTNAFLGSSSVTKGQENTNSASIVWSSSNGSLTLPYANPIQVLSEWGVTSGEVKATIIQDQLTCNMEDPSINVAIINNITPEVTILTKQSSVCSSNTPLLFTSNVVNAGDNITYDWKVNQISQGVNQEAFTLTSPQNGDVVQLTVISSLNCLADPEVSSNTITVSVGQPLVADVTIETNQTDFCAGDNITFTSTVVNEGNEPTYQWYVNSALVENASDAVFTIQSLEDGDQVSARLISNNSCITTKTVSSNVIQMTSSNQQKDVSITIESSIGDTICSNIKNTINIIDKKNITGDITYQWFLNNIPIDGESNELLSFNYNLNKGNYHVEAFLNEETCISHNPVSSNELFLVPIYSNSAFIAINTGDVACQGDEVTLTTRSEFAGDSPTFTWYLNDVILPNESGDSYTSTSLTSTDEIKVKLTSSYSCASTSYTSKQESVTILDNCINTGIQSASNNIVFYPNPFENQISLFGTDEYDVMIKNIEGRKIYNGTIYQEGKISTNDWLPGIYIVQIVQADTIKTYKIVKQ